MHPLGEVSVDDRVLQDLKSKVSWAIGGRESRAVARWEGATRNSTGVFIMAVLRALKGLSPGQIIPLSGGSAILGRHPDCDIVLDLGPVSRQHARVLQLGDQYFVEDLHSRNGTFVNEERLQGRRALAENDQIRICDVVFSFHYKMPIGLDQLTSRADGGSVVMVDDDRADGGSTVMSKLDVLTGSTGLRLTVNPEVKLKALLDIGRNLGRAIRLDDLLPRLLDNLFTIFIQADRGFILLRDKVSGRMVPKAVKSRSPAEADEIRISRTILDDVIQRKEAILSADAATDARFEMSDSIVDFHIHSMMCAPLLDSEEEVLGVIQIDTRDQRRRFSRDDLEVLASVAGQAAMAVENAQLHEQRLQDELTEREILLAHKVQQGLLPAAPPELPGYEFCDFYEPARHLGGDYFDYIPLSGGRLAMALGDVSGKGIAASLLMARLSAEVRYCLAIQPTPAEAVTRLNRIFCQSRWEGRFITFVVAVLDPARHELCLVNAGHLAPLVCRASGRVEPVGHELSGLPLGIDTDSAYQHCYLAVEPGETLVLYTDGIPDAVNAAGEFYGAERLMRFLDQAARTTPEPAGPAGGNLARRVLRDVRDFVADHVQTDDMCLTSMTRLAEVPSMPRSRADATGLPSPDARRVGG